jgi:hypothetical protein
MFRSSQPSNPLARHINVLSITSLSGCDLGIVNVCDTLT